eukprot:COSAG02_NODE_8265_length_2637_cov_3.374704_1_plen_66_part_10
MHFACNHRLQSQFPSILLSAALGSDGAGVRSHWVSQQACLYTIQLYVFAAIRNVECMSDGPLTHRG